LVAWVRDYLVRWAALLAVQLLMSPFPICKTI
jgi:hypothetical protein